MQIEDLQKDNMHMQKLMRQNIDMKLEAKQKAGKAVISQQMKAKQ